MRKLIKVIAVIIGALLLICLLTGWLLTTGPGENILRSWLEERASEEVGLPVSIGRLETNLLTRVDLDSLVVSSQGGAAASMTDASILSDSIVMRAS